MIKPISKDKLPAEHQINVENEANGMIQSINAGLIYKGVGTAFLWHVRPEVIFLVKEAFSKEGYIVMDVDPHSEWNRKLEVHVSMYTINEKPQIKQTKKPWWKL